MTTINHVPIVIGTGSTPIAIGAGGGAKPKVKPSAFLFITMVYSVYILYSIKLGVHYIGTTNDVSRRLEQHNKQEFADSFSAKGIPWELKFVIGELNSTQAFAIEKHIKKMKSVVYIENLIRFPEIVEKLKHKYK